MLRRLLALFALITGLAAFAAPAYAWGDHSSGNKTVASASASTHQAKEECEEAAAAKRRDVARKADKDEKPRKKRVVIVPSVILGGDRALE